MAIVTLAVENFHDHAKLSRSGLLGDDRGEYLADEAAIVGDADGGSDGGGSIGQRRRLIREQAYSKEEITKRQRDVRVGGLASETDCTTVVLCFYICIRKKIPEIRSEVFVVRCGGSAAPAE